MLKTTGIIAAIVSVVGLLASLLFYHRGPQDSSVVGHGVIAAANSLSLLLFVGINLALSFSLSFTPILGVALLMRMKTPTQDYRKAIETFGSIVDSICDIVVLFLGLYFAGNFGSESPLMKVNNALKATAAAASF